MDISIIGSDGKCIAALVFKTDANWIPVNLADIGKTANFLPTDIFEMQISHLDGTATRIPLMRR
jgi:hypothetical protein